MTKVRTLWHRTLNIVAVLCIVIGVQLARFGFLIIAIPGGIGLMFVLLSFVSFLNFCVILECTYDNGLSTRMEIVRDNTNKQYSTHKTFNKEM